MTDKFAFGYSDAMLLESTILNGLGRRWDDNDTNSAQLGWAWKKGTEKYKVHEDKTVNSASYSATPDSAVQ